VECLHVRVHTLLHALVRHIRLLPHDS
jgi:hypothetical protein